MRWVVAVAALLALPTAVAEAYPTTWVGETAGPAKFQGTFNGNARGWFAAADERLDTSVPTFTMGAVHAEILVLRTTSQVVSVDGYDYATQEDERVLSRHVVSGIIRVIPTEAPSVRVWSMAHDLPIPASPQAWAIFPGFKTNSFAAEDGRGPRNPAADFPLWPDDERIRLHGVHLYHTQLHDSVLFLSGCRLVGDGWEYELSTQDNRTRVPSAVLPLPLKYVDHDYAVLIVREGSFPWQEFPSWDLLAHEADGKWIGDLEFQGAKGNLSIGGEQAVQSATHLQLMGTLAGTASATPGHVSWNLDGRATYVGYNGQPIANGLPIIPVAVGIGIVAAAFAVAKGLVSRGLTLLAAKRAPLENELRKRISEAIALAPGISFNELRLRLGASRGTLRFHLQTLERAKLILKVQVGKARLFYAKGRPAVQASGLAAAKASPRRRQILGALDAEGGLDYVSFRRWAESVGAKPLSRPAFSYHVTALLRTGVVSIHRQGKRHVLVPAQPREGSLPISGQKSVSIEQAS